jgi:WD40 repeat protein
VTTSDDATARIWNTSSGKEIARLEGHSHEIRIACFDSDGSRILTASLDGTARLWDAIAGKELFRFQHNGAIYSAEFNADFDKILTVESGRLPEVSLVNGRRISGIRQQTGEARAIIWDAKNGKQLITLRHEKGVRSAAFSPDGRRVATASVASLMQ